MHSAHAEIAAFVAAYAASPGRRRAGPRPTRRTRCGPARSMISGEQREREPDRREVVDRASPPRRSRASSASTGLRFGMPGVVHEHVDAAELVGRLRARTRRARRGRRGRSSTRATRARARGTRASTSSSWSARRAQMPTVAPAAANPSASAAPMPADAPVTSTCLPLQSRTLTTRVTASLRAAMPTHARRPCCSPAGVAVVTGAAQGIGAAIATAFARFGADVAVCDRDADGLGAHRRRRSRPRAATRTPSCSTCATATRCRDWIAAARPGRRARQQRGRRVRRRVPRRQRQGPGRADPRELHQRHQLRPGVRRRRCPTRGGSIINITSIEAHRAAPGFAVYSRDEGRGREPHEDARARARRPPHPGQLHRARRDPDARHRRRRAGEDAAARSRATSTTSPRPRSTSRPTGRASSPARRSTSTAATSRPAAGAAAPTAAGSTAGDRWTTA